MTPTAAAPTARGTCLCGDVAFEVHGPLRDVVACHCGQCRKTSGHYVAATRAAAEHLTIQDPHGRLTWYESSDSAERGFCSRCGSQMFWRDRARVDADAPSGVSIHAGAFDEAPGLRMTKQIFAEDKASYYDLPDVPIVPSGQSWS